MIPLSQRMNYPKRSGDVMAYQIIGDAVLWGVLYCLFAVALVGIIWLIVIFIRHINREAAESRKPVDFARLHTKIGEASYRIKRVGEPIGYHDNCPWHQPHIVLDGVCVTCADIHRAIANGR